MEMMNLSDTGIGGIKEAEVLIKGKVINYQGNTPQFAQGSTIVSLK